MKTAFPSRFAETPGTQRRAPTSLELANGYSCGPFDLTLHNEMAYLLSILYRDVLAVLDEAGISPNEASEHQLLDAILALIAAGVGGGGGGPLAFLPLAGGTLDSNASANSTGTGHFKHAGVPYWHPDNDGSGSGLDADLLDGLQASQFPRKDINVETLANGKVLFQRHTGNDNAGTIIVYGKDGSSGGHAVYFVSQATGLAVASIAIASDGSQIEYRVTRGGVHEVQATIHQNGDTNNRKLNDTYGIASGWVADAIKTLWDAAGDQGLYGVGSWLVVKDNSGNGVSSETTSPSNWPVSGIGATGSVSGRSGTWRNHGPVNTETHSGTGDWLLKRIA